MEKDPLTSVFVSKYEYDEEFELRDRPASQVSHWWRTLTLSSYFMIATSGIATSISVGDLIAAFENKCIFYAKLRLKNLEKLQGNRTLTEDNIIVEWGSLYDCEYCEYFSVSSVVFGGILFALFLQCGRGGVTERSGSQSWGIVPLAFLIDLIFFIMSSVAFANTIGGLSYFCSYALKHIDTIDSNITSCGDILSFRYPGDIYGSNLYLAYLVAQIGISINFIGWFIAMTVILLRCLLGADFVIYQRKRFGVITTDEAEDKREIFAKFGSTTAIRHCPSEESSSDDSEAEATTSFITTKSEIQSLIKKTS